ncbi:hypothetical protein [Catellatospora sp. IY07-71]|uniref:hypothetical protein n=1 Tax=Catellatospora sp. IY07-71 TaxID=2728827 RepID=UPI001BB43BE8|nr:hypothetical protein [Catellatospora sp. IY07-71]
MDALQLAGALALVALSVVGLVIGARDERSSWRDRHAGPPGADDRKPILIGLWFGSGPHPARRPRVGGGSEVPSAESGGLRQGLP